MIWIHTDKDTKGDYSWFARNFPLLALKDPPLGDPLSLRQTQAGERMKNLVKNLAF